MMATNPHPGNDYFAQPSTGTIQRQGNQLLGAALIAAGWIGPGTWQQAQSAIADYQQATKGTPAGNATKAAKDAANAAKKVASANPLSGLQAIGDFFSRLTQANTWLRVGEVVLGVMLITSGILKLTGADGDLSGIAKTAVKVVK